VTASAQWNTPSPLVPERFTVEIFEETVSFGPVRLPITARNEIGGETFGIIAADGNVTVVMERERTSWRWQLAGTVGQAFGYMTKR
jgi:hypothetical protein